MRLFRMRLLIPLLRFEICVAAAIAVMCVLTGCAAGNQRHEETAYPNPAPETAPAPTPAPTPAPPPAPPPEPTPTPVPTVEELIKNSVYPYEVGQIMIIMYHGIFEEQPKDAYHRSIADFEKDLQALYDGGYRLISMSNLIDNNIKTPAGYTPVILSFDDGLSSSFSLVEENGELVPTPGCGVDVLTRFAEKHPDFGNTAIFYINGNMNIFAGAGSMRQRFSYLVEHGYELGNHTYSHASLDSLDAEGIQEELGLVEEIVREALPDYRMRSLSYPYGKRPKEELRQYALSGSYNGLEYSYALGVREGQSGASAAPDHVKYDPLNIPRVRGSEGAETDLWWTLEALEKNPEKRYTSDGEPNRIVVPKEFSDNVNMETQNGKELELYE